MKRPMRKALCLAIALLLAASLLPPTALAYYGRTDTYNITVNGVTFSSREDYQPVNDDTWWYSSGGTDCWSELTLNNYNGGPIVTDGYLFIKAMENTTNTITGDVDHPGITAHEFGLRYFGGSTTTITGGAGQPGVRVTDRFNVYTDDTWWTPYGFGTVMIRGGAGAYGLEGNSWITKHNLTIMSGEGGPGVSSQRLGYSSDNVYKRETRDDDGVVIKTQFLEATVTLDGNGGTLNGESAVAVKRGNIALGEYPFTREGYKLAGWMDSERIYGPNKTFYGAATTESQLTAFWVSTATSGKLSTPKNLTWGMRDSKFISVDGNGTNGPAKVLPGAMSWDLGDGGLTQNKHQINIYRNGEPYLIGVSIGGGDLLKYYYARFETPSLLMVDRMELSSGDYYYTVQAIGDGTNYQNSEIATSPVWHYTAPSTSISAPTGLRVQQDGNQITLSWEPCKDQLFCWYQISASYTYGVGGKGSFGISIGSPEQCSYTVPLSNLLNKEGANLTFRIRVISKDITQKKSSEYAEFEGTYFVSGEAAELAEIVDTLPQNPTDTQINNAVGQVKAMDSGKLALAMAADSDGTGSVADLAKLETLAGKTTQTEVSGEIAREIESEKISVIGAGLNGTGNDPVKLTLSDASGEHKEAIQRNVINTLTPDTLIFDMKLMQNGVEITPPAEQTALPVPVAIEMPIPATINPDFLVLLHLHADGSVSSEPFAVFAKNGQKYLRTVVTDFSTFLLGETVTITKDTATGTLKVAIPSNATYCAVYSAANQMLAVVDTVVNNMFTVPCDLAKAAYVKLFYVESGVPMAVAEQYSIPQESN